MPSEILNPSAQWSDQREFNATLLKLGGLFQRNFEKFTDGGDMIDPNLVKEIMEASPDVDMCMDEVGNLVKMQA